VIEVSKEQIHASMRLENSWWDDVSGIANRYLEAKPRLFLEDFKKVATAKSPRRETVLLGPRRVGKTFMLHHFISDLIEEGTDARNILYLQIDNPLYLCRPLAQLLDDFQEITGSDWRADACYVIFDEIQYLHEWEVHLKSLHDAGSETRFIVSGSAGAALSHGSKESGAGRFTDFHLPPLTFAEYIHLTGKNSLIETDENGHFATDIEQLNEAWLHYLNFGGYPEVALGNETQDLAVRYMRSDIIDKVLLRDLPSLYGISDVRELNRLFAMLAYNTGQEISLEALSKKSAVSKNTLKRYMEYLETAFLIRPVMRVDSQAKRFQRDRNYKTYLTNPSLRSGMFAPLTETSTELGALVETGVFSQLFHRHNQNIHYARWKKGQTTSELDLVITDGLLSAKSAVEVKYTDRIVKQRDQWRGYLEFCHINGLRELTITTRTVEKVLEHDGVRITFIPTALHAYRTGMEDIT